MSKVPPKQSMIDRAKEAIKGPPTAVSASSANSAFTKLVTDLVQTFRQGQAGAIHAMWSMGRLVDDFLIEAEKKNSGRYGTHSIDELSEQLKARGCSLSARSSLYHCRHVFKELSEAQIKDLSARGYSVEHARLLLPLSPDIREKVFLDLVDPATKDVMTTRDLGTKVKELTGKDAKNKADEALAPQSKAEAAKANGYTDGDGNFVEIPESKAGEAPKRDGKPGIGAAPKAPDYSKSPLPGVKRLSKALTSVVAAVADAAVALKEVPKVGFDSPVSAKNWAAACEELKACCEDTEKYLEQIKPLLKSCMLSDGAKEFAEPTAAAKAAKKKRGKFK
jgi:hypothetical protein